ncbi:MAG: GntR family transcriptional regulator [Lactobacillus sp.]|nr:GntR family transcriptional regulator [Lactobacillus sp.]
MEFKDNVPIYLQIEQRLIKQIVQGQLQAGDRLPSVRKLAVAETVNVNTVQRALRELNAQGFIYTKRGEGNFVTDDETLIEDTKAQLIQQALTEFLKEMGGLGLDHGAAQAALTDYLRKEEQDDSSQH